MKIMVIGSGGREHALVWKISQSPLASKIYCAPGNAGTAQIAENVSIAADDLSGLFKFAKENQIDLTVVGPEVPLTLGIVDLFEKEGLRIFGPSRKGAQIEGSKAFSKHFMEKYGIPTASSQVFTDLKAALHYIEKAPYRLVVKADGLAAGKGVIVCQNKEETVAAVRLVLEKKEFGRAGEKIILEECLEGEEASILAFTDGKMIVPLVSSQDHKRALDNDAGQNTGGMGAYSPALCVDDNLMEMIETVVLRRFMLGMQKEGIKYKGIIYAGVMITKEGPKVLEFNCRFGDPETQPIMMRLKSDIVQIFNAIIDEKLNETIIEWEARPAVCVVLAAGGYPGKYGKGLTISGLEEAGKLPEVMVFHAGTEIESREQKAESRKQKAESGKQIITAGGRVLGVTALGGDINEAIEKAYRAVSLIHFKDMHYRKDIGYRALASVLSLPARPAGGRGTQ